MDLEKYTERSRGLLQAAQGLALRSGHQRFTPEVRAEMGVGDGLLRLSVGLEHADDLQEDLARGLAAV